MSNNLNRDGFYFFKQGGKPYFFDCTNIRAYALSDLEYKICGMLKQEADIPAQLYPEYGKERTDAAFAALAKKCTAAEAVAPKQTVNHGFGSNTAASLELNVAQDCNMKCGYCIVNHGTFNEAAGYLSRRQAEQAVDLLLSSSDNPVCTVIFFGGEPMLNLDVIMHTVSYADASAKKYGKKMRYWIITNGTLFSKEALAFFKEHCVNVEVSIDGSRAVHDRMRVFADGGGTYDAIMADLPGLLDIKGGNRVRATVTKQCTDIRRIVDELSGLGFKGIALEMVGGEGPEYTLDDAAFEEIKSSLYELSELFLQGLPEGELKYGILFLPFLYKLLRSRPTYNYCTAGCSKLAVSVHGEIYPCKYFVGLPGYRLGMLGKGIDTEALSAFRKANVLENKPGCLSCWAKYICGGGCSAASAQINGSIGIPYEKRCRIIRFIAELSIRLLVEFRERYPMLYTDPFFMAYLMKVNNSYIE